jgi:hypothetical protein
MPYIESLVSRRDKDVCDMVRAFPGLQPIMQCCNLTIMRYCEAGSISWHAIFTGNIQQKFGDSLQNCKQMWSEFKLCLITGCQLSSGSSKCCRLISTQTTPLCRKKTFFKLHLTFATKLRKEGRGKKQLKDCFK